MSSITTSTASVVEQTGINKCPLDIIDLIIEQLDRPVAGENNRRKYNQLLACALVGRKWVHGAQRALHSLVQLDEFCVEDRLLPYLDHTHEDGQQCTKLVCRYPKILYIGAIEERDTWLQSQVIQRFAKHCGQGIPTVIMSSCTFPRFSYISTFLSQFLSAVSVELDHCWWNDTLQEVEVQPVENGHVSVSVPPYLRQMKVVFRPDGGFHESCDLLSLAKWLTNIPDDDFCLALTFLFHTQGLYSKSSATAVRLLGLKLTSLDLGPSAPELDDKEAAILDLSNNSKLRLLWLGGAEDDVPATHIVPIVSSIVSKTLESFVLRISVTTDEAADLSIFDFEGLLNVLRQKDRFPSLQLLGFSVMRGFGVEASKALLGRYLMHKIQAGMCSTRFNMGWHYLQVSVYSVWEDEPRAWTYTGTTTSTYLRW